MQIAIINGPNLNLLGKREPDVYGGTSFEEYFTGLQSMFPAVSFHYFQSNVEGELINEVQRLGFSYDGFIIIPVDTRILLLRLEMLLGPLQHRWWKCILAMCMQGRS